MSPTIQPSIRTAVTNEQVISLRHGQVVHASVNKIFPDQRAEVQIGNHKMMAKLEVPLKAGDAHYFQVLGNQETLQLKVVTDALNPSITTSNQTRQLMDSLQLPKTTEMQSIVQQMIKEKIPLSKEQLLLAEQWLKEIPPQVKLSEGLMAIQKLSELKLTFTNENFTMLISGQDKNGLHQLLDAFKLALKNDTSIPTSQKGSIEKVLMQITQPFLNEFGGAILGQVIDRLLSENTSESDKLTLLNLLKEVGLVPKQATLANWLSSEARHFQPSETNQKLPTPAADHVMSLLTSMNRKELDAKVFEQLTMLSRKSNNLVVQQALAMAEANIQSGMNGVTIEQAMKQILSNIGFDYESKLAQGSNLSQISESLKPQLLALLQNSEISAQLKETAETIVSRLNGMQILSGDNGPQHQLLMQVPLDFFGKRMDASLQWNGQMKDDGKIDSNYARVMFYLDLSSLKETVIDMQIQNRIITINVYNESEALMPYADQFREALKTGLNSLNYQLSGVFMKSYSKQPEPPPILTKTQVSKWGVDILV
ncbi:hypothetical protein M9R32_00315 [Paenisporosarcina quisquiliarum]|uniref:Hook-length control protein FliK n=1 Tax=Paenisporosarcina quisquiliarum TaxID=365346 RepID=A0A9X3LET9_9BACL|nr:hypothetical protein [Paenisporosarcina quisquiliarum]MCZ8535626.1 hypothetical protein [Paenisporosarcina quisquiliarum]